MTGEPRDSGQPYPMRLQKFLARAGVASRRGSEDLMTAGRVSVNGVVVTELGSKVDPLVDTVCVDGTEVRLADGPVYLMLDKPAGVLTTMSDPHGRPCVASYVPTGRYPGLFPVGRLDMDTTGLLLFTTDGDMGQHLLHPKHHVPKTYFAFVDGVPTKQQLGQLRRGIVLDDGPCQPADVELVQRVRGGETLHVANDLLGADVQRRFEAASSQGKAKEQALVSIVLKEGRKRQVKRMLSAVGHPVLALHRVAFGPLTLGRLAEGTWRELSADELAALRRAAGLG